MNNYKVSYSGEALSDLREIYCSIVKLNPIEK